MKLNLRLLGQILLAVLGGASPYLVSADGVSIEAGLFSIAEDDDNWNVYGVYSYLGYEFDHSDVYSSTLEVLVGLPLDKANLDGGGKLRLSNYGYGYKGTYRLTEDFSLYGRVNWTKVRVSTDSDATGFYAGLDNVEFDTLGYTLGVRYKRVSFGYNYSENRESFGPDGAGFTLGLNHRFDF